jgi:hypothetical protein
MSVYDHKGGPVKTKKKKHVLVLTERQARELLHLFEKEYIGNVPCLVPVRWKLHASVHNLIIKKLSRSR